MHGRAGTGTIRAGMNPAPEHGTDVEALLAHLGSARLRYVDIQGREAGRRALEQWPLLAKLRGSLVRDRENGVITAPPAVPR
jgi:hypothetical protein